MADADNTTRQSPPGYTMTRRIEPHGAESVTYTIRDHFGTLNTLAPTFRVTRFSAPRLPPVVQRASTPAVRWSRKASDPLQIACWAPSTIWWDSTASCAAGADKLTAHFTVAECCKGRRMGMRLKRSGFATSECGHRSQQDNTVTQPISQHEVFWDKFC